MSKNLRISCFAALGILLGGSIVQPAPKVAMLETASIEALHITPGERVVGFDLMITSGRVAKVLKAPIGWSISVDNDPSWNTRIRGSILVAAAAVNASFFRDFVVIEQNEGLGEPFQVQGEVIVSRDFVKERRIPITMRDVVLTRDAK
jgi:hypothetical protein